MCLVDILQQTLNQEKQHQTAHFLSKRVASLIIKKKRQSSVPFLFDHFLIEQNHIKLAIDVLIELVRQGQDPLLFTRYNIPLNAVTSEGKHVVLAIAEAALSKRYNMLSLSKDNLAKFGLNVDAPQAQQILIDIAKLAAKQDGRRTSYYIDKYYIDKYTSEGQKGLIEIAMLAACGATSENIQKYGIDNSTSEGQRGLIEIAKLAAEKNGFITSEYIHTYGIDKSTPEGQRALIEIAKLAAQENGSASYYIQNYGIDKSILEGQRALIEIAKLAAQQNGWETSKYIQKYGIDNSTPEGQKALIEIAQLAAQQNGWGTSQYIQNYSIDKCTSEGQRALIEIAKLAAQQGQGSISRYIQNYGIDRSTLEGQNALIEIAKLTAQHGDISISKSILDFGIDKATLEGQKGLTEIAKLAVKTIIGSENIENYGIDKSTPDGQKALIEIAKLAAQSNGWSTSKNIHNYGIDKSTPEGQKALIEIAKLAAQRSGEGTSGYIQNYGIDKSTPEGQKALIEIAKLAAQENGEDTSAYIQNYGIDKSTPEGQKVLIEIAKLAAEQNGVGTSRYLRNYGIDICTPEGYKTLIAIAKQSAQQNGVKTYRYIKNYGIDKSTPEGKHRYAELSNFIFICIVIQMKKISVETFKKDFEYFLPNNSSEDKSAYGVDLLLFDRPYAKLSAGDLAGAANDCLDICEKKMDIPQNDLEWIQETLSRNKEPYIQKNLLNWFMTTASLCSSHQNLMAGFKTQQEIIKEISKQPPTMRDILIKKFINLHYHQNIQGWEELKKATEGITHVQLASLVLATFPPKDERIYKQVLATLKNERIFREGKHQKLLLETLIKIEMCSLEEAEKNCFIDKLFKMPFERRLQSLRLFLDILAFKGEADLREIHEFVELQDILVKLFKTKFSIKLDHFSELYEKSIAQWRNKEALITFASKLNELPSFDKGRAQELFQQLLTQIMQGSFLKDRYAVDLNPHLAEINKDYPDILEKWQMNESLSTEELELKDKVEIIPVADRIFYTLKQALEQNHLGGIQPAVHYPYVTACQGNWSKLEENLASLNKALVPYSGRSLSEEEGKKKQWLLLQKKLLELLSEPQDLEKKLKDLKSLIPNTEVFYRDIEDSIKMLQIPAKKTTYQVIDTDDPNHFLLMGTEVLNSCQNVNGSASLNVCLLGYFMDGKHRLSLVCDQQGRILARSVLRLLIDSEGQPVLFQEKIYVADSAQVYPHLLRKLAMKKAASLGIPLVVSQNDFENEQATGYPNPVQAKEKPVPFEYVDAKNGIEPGPYVIYNTLQVD